MTTKKAGGVIRPYFALTLEATYAAAVGDPVMITGDYECDKADGSKEVIGKISAITKKVPAAGGNREVANPGDVTVEAFGYGVLTFTTKTNQAITAGDKVAVDSNGELVPAGSGTATVGIALHGVTATASTKKQVDVLVGQPLTVTA